MDKPSVTITPTVINLGAPNSPKKKFFSTRILFGGLGVLVLAIGLGLGTFLVRRQGSQDIGSKATGCGMLWPVGPNDSACYAKLIPQNDATTAPVRPDFHWEYEGCVDTTGCGQYGAVVFLSTTNSFIHPFAGANINSGTLIKDASFSLFKVCDYGNIFPNDPDNCHTDGMAPISDLKPNTDYWWRVQPYFNGTVHAEQTYNYHFKTTAASTSFVCTGVTMTPTETTVVAPGETRSLTAAATGGTAPVTFSWTASGGTLSGNTGATVTWTAPATLTASQTWTITATASDSSNPPKTDTSGCTKTLTFTITPAGTAACQQVTLNKDKGTINVGDVLYATGSGTTTGNGDKIDIIEFTVSKDGIPVVTKQVTTALDTVNSTATTQIWKATSDAYVVPGSGSYSITIRDHWLKAGNIDGDWQL